MKKNQSIYVIIGGLFRDWVKAVIKRYLGYNFF